MNNPALVCDTSVLLYLARISQVHLIPALFEPVYVPEPVVWELDAGRSLRPDTFDPRSQDWLNAVSVSRSEFVPTHRLPRYSSP